MYSNYYYTVGYRDSDGFFQQSIDARGRLIICESHYAACVEMLEHISYIDSKLENKKEIKKSWFDKLRIMKYFKPKPKVPLLTNTMPEYEKMRLRRERQTILIKKVRILG